MENKKREEILVADTELEMSFDQVQMNIEADHTNEFVDKEIKIEIKEEDPLKLGKESAIGDL